MTDADPLLDVLAQLDPTATDLPPQRGSTRDRLILERAMQTDGRPDATPPVPLDRARRRLRPALLAGAAVAAAVLGVLVVAQPDQAPDPVAALTMAADTTGEVDSLRVHGTYQDARGTRTLEGEIDGADRSARITRSDGSTEWFVHIGDQYWDDEEEGPTTVTPEMVSDQFPGASRAVLKAALEGAAVREAGTEEVAGVEATHYAIDLGPEGVAALSALSPSQVAQFELEYPAGVTGLDVWVADDLIRKIVVVSEQASGPDGAPDTVTVTLEFTDFGADITIRPPA